MTITLRRLHPYGKAIGAGAVVHDRHHNGWIVDNWSPGALVVYCRKPGREQEAPVGMGPQEIGCYIGHEAGQPVSAIKWGGQPKPPKAPKLWFVASYGDGGLDVQFYSDPLAYGRAVREAKIAWEQGHNETGEDIDSYTNGEAKA